MPKSDEPQTPAPKAAASQPRKLKPASPAKAANGVYSFTVDTAKGQVVTVERVDSAGARHSLSAAERAKFAADHPAMPLRQLVERAFEAGIEFVLGDDTGPDSPESPEDTEISGELIQTMIGQSKAGKLLKGSTLDRAAIVTLIGHAAS